MEDRVLLKGVLHGSVPAFKKLMTEYIPLVSRTSYRILCDRSDSEYVTREVFIMLWHDPLFFMYERTLPYALLRKTCTLSRMRLMRRRMYKLFSIYPDVFVVSSPIVASADECIARQAWEVFCRASLNCSETQRVIYCLCELEGMSLKEAAYVGRYPEFMVEDALDAARKKVKEELDVYGRMGDYISYVSFLRRVEDQLTDKVRLQTSIIQDLFS